MRFNLKSYTNFIVHIIAEQNWDWHRREGKKSLNIVTLSII